MNLVAEVDDRGGSAEGGRTSPRQVVVDSLLALVPLVEVDVRIDRSWVSRPGDSLYWGWLGLFSTGGSDATFWS